jgi:hypothetical protein
MNTCCTVVKNNCKIYKLHVCFNCKDVAQYSIDKRITHQQYNTHFRSGKLLKCLP